MCVQIILKSNIIDFILKCKITEKSSRMIININPSQNNYLYLPIHSNVCSNYIEK